MLHPSYTDLINAVNSEVEPGEQPVVQSRYSIVLATSKRARQIIGDNDAEEAEEAKAIEAAADGDPEAFGIEAEQVEE